MQRHKKNHLLHFFYIYYYFFQASLGQGEWGEREVGGNRADGAKIFWVVFGEIYIYGPRDLLD